MIVSLEAKYSYARFLCCHFRLLGGNGGNGNQNIDIWMSNHTKNMFTKGTDQCMFPS